MSLVEANPVLKICPAPAGLNTDASEDSLFVATDYGYQCTGLRQFSNLLLHRHGRMVFAGGDRAILSAANAVDAIAIWDYSSGATRLIVYVDAGANTVYTYNEATLTRTNIGSTAGLTADSVVKIAQWGSYLYFTGLYASGGDAGKLAVWRGTGNIEIAGVAEPSLSAPHWMSAGAGNVNTTNFPDARWVVTVEHPTTGLESNPTPMTEPGSITNEKIVFDTFGTDLVDLVADGYTLLNIYRLGGTLADFQHVAQHLVEPGGAAILFLDGTTDFPYDDTADADASIRTPPTSHGMPPLNATDLLLHQSRLFLAVGSRLYFSRSDHPEYFGQDDNGADDDGGYQSPDLNDSDTILCMSSTGNLLILGRRETIYAVYGNSFRTMSFDKINNKGVENAWSLVRCDNVVRFVCPDRRIYDVGDKGSIGIAAPIQSTLDDIGNEWDKCRSVYHDGRLLVTFPSSDTETTAFAYDERTGQWTRLAVGNLAFPRLVATGLYSRRNPTTRKQELLVGFRQGGIAASLVEDAQYHAVALQSGDLRIDSAEWEIRAVGVLVQGSVTQLGSSPLTLEVRVGALAHQVYTATISGINATYTGNLFRVTFRGDMVGDYLRATVYGSLSACDLTAFRVEYVIERKKV